MKDHTLNTKPLKELNTFPEKEESPTTTPLNIKLNIFPKFIKTDTLVKYLIKKNSLEIDYLTYFFLLLLLIIFNSGTPL